MCFLRLELFIIDLGVYRLDGEAVMYIQRNKNVE